MSVPINRFLQIILLLITWTTLLLIPYTIVFADTPQNITVSLTIPSGPRDYQFSFTSVDNTTDVHQSNTLSYQIVYGAKKTADSTTAITIVADFSKDTASGGDILDYVAGSATNGYNNTPPVVDLIHKKITWAISALPAGTTDQIVAFQLQTNNNYTGTNAIPFSITASMTKEADQIMTQTYRYTTPKTTPITPTFTPNPSTGSGSPTPATLPGITFSNISLQSLTSNAVSLGVDTNIPTKLKVFYGTILGNMSQSITSLSFGTNQTITVANLVPHTTYYVKFEAIDQKGNSKISDIYTFLTAQTAEHSQINASSIVFFSSDIAMYTPNPNTPNGQQVKPMIIIPQGNSYNFRFQLNNNQFVTKVLAIVRNSHVLGITAADSVEPNTLITELIETGPGLYEGRLKTPIRNGDYLTFVRVYDSKGNITEEPIASVHVSQGITIQESATGKAIEGAQIVLYYKNFRTKQFEILPSQLFPIKNPDYSDIHGQITTPLPLGTYKVSVTAIGYEQKNVIFTLGTLSNETYPTIYLKKNPFSITTMLVYYWTIGRDTLQTTKLYIQNISNSSRFFELNALLATAFLVFLTLLSFAAKLHIPLRSLFDYFIHIKKIQRVQNTLGEKIKGRIFDSETGDNLQGGIVFLIDEHAKSIVGYTTTDKTGNFTFSTTPTTNYSLQIMEKGYEPVVFHVSEIEAVGLGGYLLGIKRKQSSLSFLTEIKLFAQKMLALTFEALLLISLIFEVSLGYALGFEKTILFLIFSLINIMLWVMHLTHLRSERNIF